MRLNCAFIIQNTFHAPISKQLENLSLNIFHYLYGSIWDHYGSIGLNNTNKYCLSTLLVNMVPQMLIMRNSDNKNWIIINKSV